MGPKSTGLAVADEGRQSHQKQRLPTRMRFIFFLRALHKMADVGNLLDSSISVDLEREVLIYTEIRTHKQDHRSQLRTFLVTPLVSEAQLRY